MAKKVKEEKQGLEGKLEKLELKYGIGKVPMNELTIIDTGSIQLNRAMKIGGTAVGKIIELFGNESSGKSTIALHQMAEYQRAFPNRRVALMDFENSFDMNYAKALGVDIDKLIIYQPDNQEIGYDIILDLIKEDIVSCIVIDSQTAAAPKAIIDGEMGDATIGLQARNNSKFCLKVKGLLNIHNVTLFIISQIRDNIGNYGGDSTTTTGGKAIKFYSDVRWKIWKTNDKINELNKTTVDVIKNKLGIPFGSAKINILWGVGFDKLGEIIDYAEEFGFIKKGGAGWYSIGDVKLQGMEKVKNYFDEFPDELIDIHSKVMNKLAGIKEEEEIETINEENNEE